MEVVSKDGRAWCSVCSNARLRNVYGSKPAGVDLMIRDYNAIKRDEGDIRLCIVGCLVSFHI